MRALRTRLMIALAVVLLVTWGGWFALQYRQMSAHQVGEIDGMLRNVAEQLLQSLPADVTAAGQQARLLLSTEAAKNNGGKFDALVFQAWDLHSRRSVLSSRTAPPRPLQPEFVDGSTRPVMAGAPWRVYAVSDAQRRVQFQVGIPEAAVKVELRRWFRASLGTALVLIVAFAVAVWGVLQWSLRPVVRIRDALERRAPLDLAALPAQGLPTEFAPLVRAFNQLLARFAQALQHEREFLGEAAHELRTPLAALLAQAQVVQHAGDRDEARDALVHLVAGIERTSRLAQQLLDTARVDAGAGATRAVDLDLALVATMVADEFEQVAARNGQSIAVDARHAPVHGDIDDLGILVRNLVDNALRHGGHGTRVRLSTSIEHVDGMRVATLVVADDGPGIPEAERARVFERFYRAGDGHRPHGIGMGLSLVQRVVNTHGGSLACGDGLDGRGFGITIRFPARTAG